MSEPASRFLRVLPWTIAAMLMLVLIAVPLLLTYPEHYVVLPSYFLFGWLTYPIKTIPLLNIQSAHVAIFLITLSVFVFGVHRLARWLHAWGALTFTPGSSETHWPWRRTLLLCALLMTFFGAGIAAIGTFHQSAWLANFKEPWVKDMRFGSSNEDHVYMLTHRANTQKWSNAEMHAAVNHANTKLDGRAQLIVAHDSRGNWCAIFSRTKADGNWYIERGTRDYEPQFYPKGETLEELLESCSRFTPPESAKTEATR